MRVYWGNDFAKNRKTSGVNDCCCAVTPQPLSLSHLAITTWMFMRLSAKPFSLGAFLTAPGFTNRRERAMSSHDFGSIVPALMSAAMSHDSERASFLSLKGTISMSTAGYDMVLAIFSASASYSVLSSLRGMMRVLRPWAWAIERDANSWPAAAQMVAYLFVFFINKKIWDCFFASSFLMNHY